MITEEALPTYMSMLNTLDGVRDETGASDTPWATWTRQWTAEENRHGDIMNKYMYLTGECSKDACVHECVRVWPSQAGKCHGRDVLTQHRIICTSCVSKAFLLDS